MEMNVTPEERQLLTTLAERIRSTPPQQQDAEAAQLLQQLVSQRPDAVYILAQTVLMQDFALRNAQAQIEDLQRQMNWQQQPSERSSGSFLGGGQGSGQQYQPNLGSGSVPSVNPWARRPAGDYPPPPEPGNPGYGPIGPVMQPSQTSGFLRSAASTAAGVAGGALLFQGINSLFSGHHSGLLGGGLSGMKPADSLSAATAVGPQHGDPQTLSGGGEHQAGSDTDRGHDSDMDADYGDDGDDGDFGGGDYA
jgi:hypothetical protein